MKQTVYLETTIPSYLAARTSNNIIIAGKQATTHEFFENHRHKYDLVISRFVLDECSKGDPSAAKRRLDWLQGIALLPIALDVQKLADIYLRLLSIPEKSKIDAQHLAICCVHEVDILLSWNCSHLGIDSMKHVEKYNNYNGLHTPRMITPDFLVEVDLDE